MQKDIETDVLIIGAGPAGLAAALYTARANKRTIVLKGKTPSRLSLAHKVENYSGFISVKGTELLDIFETQAISHGAELMAADAIDMALSYDPKMINTRNGMILAKTVIIATGKGVNVPIVENEETLIGFGVSYCAVCDGAFYKNKQVMVYGKDEEAIHDAFMLAELGCKTTLLYKPTLDQIPPGLLAGLQSRSIDLLDSVELKKVVGTQLIESVIVLKDGQERQLNTQALFIIDHAPGSTLFKRAGLDLDAKNNLFVSRGMETNIPGVFAAGDVTGVGLQVATSVGDGVTAALGALKFLKI